MVRNHTPRQLALVVIISSGLIGAATTALVTPSSGLAPATPGQQLLAMNARMPEVSLPQVLQPGQRPEGPVIWADEYPPPLDQPPEPAPARTAPPGQDRAILPPPQLIGGAAPATAGQGLG